MHAVFSSRNRTNFASHITLAATLIWSTLTVTGAADNSTNRPWDCVVVRVTGVDKTQGTRGNPPAVQILIEEILTRGKYPDQVKAIWEPLPVICGTGPEARPDWPVNAPAKNSRWVAWIQSTGDKGKVLLRSYMSHPFSPEMRLNMAKQCHLQGMANDRIARELDGSTTAR